MSKEMPPKKKPYQKPEINIIDLAADEVLALGCKTPTTVTISNSTLPGPGCATQNCLNTGS
ncbi:MAG: hypothetical protein MUE70_15120 [Desulfobacterales bacterium]|jgi:hypothetical protein|nr:hypothetical protein [Desulfobacterales bacterium]